MPHKGTFKLSVLYCRYPRMTAPVQVLMVGTLLVFATPLCCALFPQMSSIKTSKLEPHLQEELRNRSIDTPKVYFNKGL